MNKCGLKNESDNVKRTIKFLEAFLLIEKTKKDNQIYRVCVWPKHIRILLPPIDFIFVQKEYRKLFKN